jgi:hypothetical protein
METRTKLCDINPEGEELLPPKQRDNSGIGVYYVDAFIKPMNAQLSDGTTISCKRRGLKIILSVGEKKGEALMRRLEVSPDPRVMLQAALRSAAEHAGVRLEFEANEIHISISHE